jgi:AraC-like DNA-binding protein
MPSSIVRNFSDPDHYAASMRAARSEATVTEPGQFSCELIRVDLHEMWMQRFCDNRARVISTTPDTALMMPEPFAFVRRHKPQAAVSDLAPMRRRRLHHAGPRETRVTDIAAGFGFWSFGRFSPEYRRQFGESPSATLRAADGAGADLPAVCRARMGSAG